jgi:hypothetical protein
MDRAKSISTMLRSFDEITGESYVTGRASAGEAHATTGGRTFMRATKGFAILLPLALFLASGCTRDISGSADTRKRQPGSVRIGFSMDSLQVERWQRDRDQFVARGPRGDRQEHDGLKSTLHPSN